jgi:tetratricopeptide (TPR) repeat protein
VDAAELDRQTRTYSGCIAPHLIARLFELGYEDEVEFWAGHGEWFCAQAWARRLSDQGLQAEALEVLAPYVATEWWTAVRFAAVLLEDWGRPDEAIATIRRHSKAGNRLMAEYLGRLLARHGCGDEAFDLLSPHIRDWFLAAALAEVAEVSGRAEEAAALLTARIEAGSGCETPGCLQHRVEPDNAIGLLAGIRERQGRTDEAIDLLHTRMITSVNSRDQLADLLARHGLVEQLQVYAAVEHHGHAAQRLAELLEERGDIEAAIAVYRQPSDSRARHVHGAAKLAQLLVRHDRGDEAIAVIRALAESPDGAQDWIVDMLCTLYADQERAHEGLAYLDAFASRRGEEEWEFFRIRLKLLVASGQRDEAIELTQAHCEGDTWYAAAAIGEMLAEAGRIEEAVAILAQHASTNSSVLAWHLIGLGRVHDAVAIARERKLRTR